MEYILPRTGRNNLPFHLLSLLVGPLPGPLSQTLVGVLLKMLFC